MKLITLKSVLPTIKKQFKKNPNNFEITISTWKQDRLIKINKNESVFNVQVNGYEHINSNNLNEKECLSTIKKSIKTEFPRSHKIHITIKDSL